VAQPVKRFTLLSRVILLLLLFPPFNIFAAHDNVMKKPLWEFGLGVGGLNVPDYRGSDERRSILFPIPYFVYRGDRLFVDRRGARGLIYESGNLAVNISGDLGLPVNSDKNQARSGMPDLDIAFLLGPSFDYLIYDKPQSGSSLTFKVPMQLVITTDFSSVDTQGWFSFPHFNYIHKADWTLGTTLGLTFASKDFHNYYYGVAPQFATTDRPAYDASGGYSGFRTSFTLSKRFRRFWIGTAMRYQYLGGTVFENSPLLKQNYSLAISAGISWILFSSSEREK